MYQAVEELVFDKDVSEEEGGLARTGERKFNKRLGSSLLRHSYLSHKYADVAEEKAKDADMMGHSVEMADGYIRT